MKDDSLRLVLAGAGAFAAGLLASRVVNMNWHTVREGLDVLAAYRAASGPRRVVVPPDLDMEMAPEPDPSAHRTPHVADYFGPPPAVEGVDPALLRREGVHIGALDPKEPLLQAADDLFDRMDRGPVISEQNWLEV